MVMINFSFKTIWHIKSKQRRVVLDIVVKAEEEWMVIPQLRGEIDHAHLHTFKTNPGGKWTLESWSVLLKCTLSTETMQERDCQILRSELVCNHLYVTTV